MSATVINTPNFTAPEKTAPAAWWRTRRARQAGWIAAAAVVIGASTWYFAFRPYVRTDDARVAMTLVRVAPAGIGGRIEKVNVTEGSRVKKGDVLVEIDHRVAEAQVARAKAKADLAAREYERMLRLSREGSATPQARDVAQSNAAAADAELKLAEHAVENTYLRSPFDGVVLSKMAEVGNLLEPGQAAIVVADEANAWIAANIEETSVGAVKVGQTVHVSIDEGGTLEGKVSEVRAAAASTFALIPNDTGAGNFTKVVQRIPIKIQPEGGVPAGLRVGQSVELRIRVR